MHEENEKIMVIIIDLNLLYRDIRFYRCKLILSRVCLLNFFDFLQPSLTLKTLIKRVKTRLMEGGFLNERIEKLKSDMGQEKCEIYLAHTPLSI